MNKNSKLFDVVHILWVKDGNCRLLYLPFSIHWIVHELIQLESNIDTDFLMLAFIYVLFFQLCTSSLICHVS